jgi:hypothetical protein
MTVIVSLDSPSCEVPCLILHSVVYWDVTRHAKVLHYLEYVGAVKREITYLIWCNSDWFCHSLGKSLRFRYNRIKFGPEVTSLNVELAVACPLDGDAGIPS